MLKQVFPEANDDNWNSLKPNLNHDTICCPEHVTGSSDHMFVASRTGNNLFIQKLKANNTLGEDGLRGRTLRMLSIVFHITNVFFAMEERNNTR